VIKAASLTSLGLYLSEGGYSDLLIGSELTSLKDIYVVLQFAVVPYLVVPSLIMPYFTCLSDQLNVFLKKVVSIFMIQQKEKERCTGDWS
jgi:hypothetical protein